MKRQAIQYVGLDVHQATVVVAHVERVVVCNIRGRGETGNKNDRLDADRLSELLRLGSLKPVYHGASGLLTLQELVRSYVNLVEDGTRAMLRIKALLRLTDNS